MTTRRARFLMLLANVWFIACAALGTRLAFAWHQQSHIPHEALASVPFENEAGNIAFALSEGHGFANLFRRETGPTAWLAPVYPGVLSLIFRVFGAFTLASFCAAVLVNVFLSAAATFPLYAIARRVAGQGVAVASAWAWAVLPAGILMPFEWIWDTPLSVLLSVALVWATLRVAESKRHAAWGAYGVLWALALLTNPVLGIGLPVLVAWAALRVRLLAARSWSLPVACVAVLFLCCLPWTLRNYRQFQRFIPIRSSLPFELWIGNNDIFDEHEVHGIRRITRYEEIRRYGQLGETAYLDEKSQMARSFIRQKPALFLKLTEGRVLATWSGTEHPVADFRGTDSLLVRTVIGVNFVLTLGTLSGTLLLLLRMNRFALPLAVFPVLYPLIYYVTHTSLRYRHPIDPMLILLTVFAAAYSFQVFRPGSLERLHKTI